jgi:hypothetical protein
MSQDSILAAAKLAKHLENVAFDTNLCEQATGSDAGDRFIDPFSRPDFLNLPERGIRELPPAFRLDPTRVLTGLRRGCLLIADGDFVF